MEPQDLADAVEAVIRSACARVGPDSIGAQQYHTPGEPQKFEVINIGEMLEMYEEELLDITTYATMTIIKLRRMRQRLEELESWITEMTNEARDHQSEVNTASGERPDGLPSGPGTFIAGP
jgi:hypothetical protein